MRARQKELSAQLDRALDGRSPASRRLGVATLYVLLGNAFTLVVGLPLQIYVARVLGPDGVGVYGLLEAAMATVTGLCGFGIGQTTMRFIPAHLEHSEYGEARGILRLGGIILLAVGSAAYAIVLLALPWIVTFWPELKPYHTEVVTMGLVIPIGLFNHFLQQSLRGFQEIRQMVFGSSVMQLSCKALLTVAAFTIGMRLDGYILATVLSASCGATWLLYKQMAIVRALPTAQASASAFPQWYSYALVAYSSDLLSTVASGLDRFLLGAFVGSGAVGVLLAASQLNNIPTRFNQILLMVGAPLLSAAHAREDRAERQHIFYLMTDWSVRCALPLVAFLLFFAKPALALYGPEFAERGTLPLQILVVGQFFILMCGPVGNVAIMSGYERKAFLVSAMTVGVLVALFVGLIPRFELIGAAVALSLGGLFHKLATMRLVRRRLSLHWWDRRYLAWLPQAAVVALLAGLAANLPWRWGAVALLAQLAAMYAVALLVNVVVGLHDDDRDLARHVWARIVRAA